MQFTNNLEFSWFKREQMEYLYVIINEYWIEKDIFLVQILYKDINLGNMYNSWFEIIKWINFEIKCKINMKYVIPCFISQTWL